MNISDTFNHLGSIWYQPEPLEVPYYPNQFLGLDFFAVSYSKPALVSPAPSDKHIGSLFEIQNNHSK